MRDLDDLFAALARSRFRSRFRLGGPEREYLASKTLTVVMEHGRDLLRERLAPAEPRHDGRQTPMRGHPVFVAQHATATCCRGCLAKWHGIEKGRPLTGVETNYILQVIERWLRLQSGGQRGESAPGDDKRRRTETPSSDAREQLTLWQTAPDNGTTLP